MKKEIQITETKAWNCQVINKIREYYKLELTEYKNHNNNPQMLTSNKLQAWLALLPKDLPLKEEKSFLDFVGSNISQAALICLPILHNRNLQQ